MLPGQDMPKTISIRISAADVLAAAEGQAFRVSETEAENWLGQQAFDIREWGRTELLEFMGERMHIAIPETSLAAVEDELWSAMNEALLARGFDIDLVRSVDDEELMRIVRAFRDNTHTNATLTVQLMPQNGASEQTVTLRLEKNGDAISARA